MSTETSPNPHQAMILFADLVGSARMSDILSPAHYDDVVSAFQSIAKTEAESARKELKRRVGNVSIDIDLRGDQLVLIVVLDNNANARSRLKAARRAAEALLKLAVNLSTKWFFSEANKGRIETLSSPYRVSVGLHYGTVILKNRERHFQGNFSNTSVPEGFAINFAKRVESASRHGTSSGITLSQSFATICRGAGFPVFLSAALETDAKGFESFEPIFEITAQELVIPTEFKRNAAIKNAARVQEVFRRDPVRMRWLLELALEGLFRNYNSRSWKKAKTIAVEASTLADAPARFHFDAGRSAHKLGWHAKCERANLQQLRDAIRLNRAALTDPLFVWAASDLALVHLRFLGDIFKCPEQPSETISLEEKWDHAHEANKYSCLLVEKMPQHFHSYFSRALTRAKILQFAPEPPCEHPSWYLPERFRREAKQDLVTAERINKAPKYIYLCAEVELGLSNHHPTDTQAEKTRLDSIVDQAEKSLRETRDSIDGDFYQQGVVVAGFRPPPRESFESRFKILRDDIKSAWGN